MRVPFHLRRMDHREPACALLLNDDVAQLLEVCARSETWPAIYPVANGFLVVLEDEDHAPWGAIRLRALAPNVYLPVDAELVPALFPDEAGALAREHGVIFLPDSRVLAYDLESALRPSALVRWAKVESDDWQPLPDPGRLATQLRIIVEVPPPSVEQIIEEGGSGIGEEEPRPRKAGPIDTARAHVRSWVGRSLVWFGKGLDWHWLTQRGAEMIASAVELAPRLSESVLGKQEAALRQLLEDFRAGRLEQALKRALPMGDNTSRGQVTAQDAELPTHSLLYSLGDLLGGTHRGPTSVWFGGGDVMQDLFHEYRKAAQQALERGDHRRAAYIYAKLLSDYRQAANVLSAGGLHRDAAVVYLDKLGSPSEAAREYEQAGDFDKALELYRREGDHRSAGDVLRRLGEIDDALAEYELAATKLARKDGYAVAGDLFANHVGRADLAFTYYETGWRIGSTDASTCLKRLAKHHSDRADHDAYLELTQQATEYFTRRGSGTDVSEAFSELVRVARGAFDDEVRDEVEDTALGLLASRLHERARASQSPGAEVSLLLGRRGIWPTELVSDADAAFRHALDQPRIERPRADGIETPLTDVTIVSSAWALETGAVIVLDDMGELIRYDPRTNSTTKMLRCDPSAHSLATDPRGNTVLAVATEDGSCHIECIHAAQEELGFSKYSLEHPVWVRRPRVSPVRGSEISPFFVLYDGSDLQRFTIPHLLCLGVQQLGTGNVEEPSGMFLVRRIDDDGSRFFTALFDDDRLYLQGDARKEFYSAPLGAAGALNAECDAPFQYIVRLADEGCPEIHLLRLVESRLAYSLFRLTDAGLVLVRCASSSLTGYSAGCLVAPNRIVGVFASGLRWMTFRNNRFEGTHETQWDLRGPVVACYPSLHTHEVQVLMRDGRLLRFSVPH